jgi:hypothetical protein
MPRAVPVLVAALALADAAGAAYVPRLFAGHVPNGVEVSFRQTAADDATASLAVYVPSSYASTHATTPAGTPIGRVSSARVEVRAVGPGVVLTLDGTVVADNPANHLSNTCSPGLHQAVWIASLAVPNQPQAIRIPVYVDSTAGALDAALGAVRLQACFPSSEVPESQGGAPLGAKLLEATFRLDRVFTPQGAGVFEWNGHFVPYVPLTRTPNIAGRVGSRAFVRTPGQVTLRGRRVTRERRHFARLTGTVTEAGQGVPATVRIARDGRTRTVRTSANGTFAITVPLRRTSTFRAQAAVPARDVTATGCAVATTPPCVSASAAGFQDSSGAARVTVPRAKPKR